MSDTNPYEIAFPNLPVGRSVAADDVTDLFPDDSEFAARVAELYRQRILTHNVLAAVRAAAGITQEEVAAVWGRAQANVSRLEHSELASVQIRSVAGYLEALGASVRLVVELKGSRVEVPLSPSTLGRVVARSA